MRTLITSIAVLFLVLSLRAEVAAQYENQGYLPLTRTELSKRFPVTYIGTLGVRRPGYFEDQSDKTLPNRIGIGPSGAVVTTPEDTDLIITGKDKLQREWSIQLGYPAVAWACRFYEADLDRNGIRDAVLVFPTGGNGLAPTSHFLAITFDERGRPVTFEADGYFQEPDGQIFDLVDLNRNGRAELIYMKFDDGYWITSIYEVRNARWQRIVGRHANRTYPLYTRFTIKENHRAVTPKRGLHPFTPDLSNSSPQLTGRLVSYNDDLSLVIQKPGGKSVTSKPDSWYGSFAVVLDSPDGRKIVSMSAERETLRSLLNKIVSDRCEVTLFGTRDREGSSPELLWAVSTKEKL